MSLCLKKVGLLQKAIKTFAPITHAELCLCAIVSTDQTWTAMHRVDTSFIRDVDPERFLHLSLLVEKARLEYSK
jgi:hypothetical protein